MHRKQIKTVEKVLEIKEMNLIFGELLLQPENL